MCPRSVVLQVFFFLQSVSLVLGLSLLQPLPAQYDAGKATVVFVRDNLAILPDPFAHENNDEPFFDVRVEDEEAREELRKLKKAQFIAFDARFFDIIGARPTLDRLFDLPRTLKEAPIYLPAGNRLYFGDMGMRKYYRVRLDASDLSLEEVFIRPDLPGLNAAVYEPISDLIYATVNPSAHLAGGLYTIDPATLQSRALVNNFVGRAFNSPNDLTVDRDGGVYFTDPPYAWEKGNFTNPVRLRSTVYFFNSTSKLLRAIEEDLDRPNGIALSADGRTLFIADTGALAKPPGQPTIETRHHSIYAYDLSSGGRISNKRLLFRSDFWVPDGIKVSSSGLVFAASGIFVDVVDGTTGQLLGKIAPGGVVQNLVFAGKEYNELWMVGIGGVFRARIQERGIPLEKACPNKESLIITKCFDMARDYIVWLSNQWGGLLHRLR